MKGVQPVVFVSELRKNEPESIKKIQQLVHKHVEFNSKEEWKVDST